MKTYLLACVVFCFFAAIGFQDATDAQKKEFIELLRTLPTRGEFYTPESVQKAKPYLPVLLSLTEKDIENIGDLYPFVALSSGLAREKENRVYVLTHFAKIRHPDLKMLWAVLLFNEGDVSKEVVNHLLEALKEPERAKLLGQMVGPDFKFFKRKVLSHPLAMQNGVVQPIIEDEGHAGWITSVAFSPDGATLVSGSHDGTFILWNVATGKQIRSIEDHRSSGRPFEVVSVAFSPDGKKIASASSDSTVRVWDATTGAPVWKFSKVTYAHHVVFSADSRRLAVANCDTVKVWNLANGSLLRTLKKAEMTTGSGYCSQHVAFLNNGNDLLADGGPIQIWNVSTGRELKRFKPQGSVQALDLSADGTKLLLGEVFEGYLGVVELWEVATAKLLRRLPEEQDPVESVAFAPDGKIAASERTEGNDISSPGTIVLWDLTTGTELRKLAGHNMRVDAIAFSPDGKTLASGSWDHSVKLWDVATGKEIRSFPRTIR